MYILYDIYTYICVYDYDTHAMQHYLQKKIKYHDPTFKWPKAHLGSVNSKQHIKTIIIYLIKINESKLTKFSKN